jgi:regulator of replication initiation timing
MLKTYPPVSNQAIDYQKTVQELEAKVGELQQTIRQAIDENLSEIGDLIHGLGWYTPSEPYNSDYKHVVRELEANVGKIRQDLSAILEERFEAVFYTLQSELPDFTPAQA